MARHERENEMSQVQKARRAQEAAWERMQCDDSVEAMQAWSKAVDAQRAAEEAAADAADRWEAWEAERESRQSDWWVAAWSNARSR